MDSILSFPEKEALILPTGAQAETRQRAASTLAFLSGQLCFTSLFDVLFLLAVPSGHSPVLYRGKRRTTSKLTGYSSFCPDLTKQQRSFDAVTPQLMEPCFDVPALLRHGGTDRCILSCSPTSDVLLRGFLMYDRRLYPDSAKSF